MNSNKDTPLVVLFPNQIKSHIYYTLIIKRGKKKRDIDYEDESHIHTPLMFLKNDWRYLIISDYSGFG